MKNKLECSLGTLIGKQFVDFWYYYFGAFLCLGATHWIQSHLPFLAKDLADLVEKGTGSIPTWQFFALALGIIIFRTSSRLLFFYPARVLQKELRVELLEKLEDASPIRYRHHSDGQLFQILQMDMEQLRALIGFALLQVGNILIAMAILIPKLISFQQDLIIALIPLFVAFTLFTIIVSRNKKYYKAVQDLQGDVQNIIVETYAGKKTIKNFHAEESFVAWFREVSREELRQFYYAGLGVGVSMPLLPLGIGLSLLWGSHIVFVNDLGASSLILFSGFIFLFLEPISFLSWIGVVFARSYGSWQRIQSLVSDIYQDSSQERRIKKDNPLRELKKENGFLSFKVHYWDELLKLKFPEKKWSVFIGNTGAGKSHLLTEVADSLKLNGQSISYVAQDPYLYSDLIINNIFLGQGISEKSKDEAYDLLVLFGLDYLAANKEALFQMEVGEKGKRLSGGQVKRLCLVRSLMAKADILIWDDPFSSVDLILEKKIIEELKNWEALKEKTIILSSHRITTVRYSDFSYLLDKDKKTISEEGPTFSLLTPGHETYEYFQNQMV